MKNKLKFLAVFALLTVGFANAQVGVGTTTPDASAVLDVSSTTKGLLLPRVASGASITTPAKGLVIFNTTSNQAEVNTGTPAVPVWSALGGAPALNVTVPTTDNYTVLATDNIIYRQLTGAGTLTFPASLPAGKVFYIANTSGGSDWTFSPAPINTGAALVAAGQGATVVTLGGGQIMHVSGY